MKIFKVPMVEIVYFDQKDIIATSACFCVECLTCEEGNDCKCNDVLGSDQ